VIALLSIKNSLESGLPSIYPNHVQVNILQFDLDANNTLVEEI